MTKAYDTKEIWFFTGSQDLYGEETLRQVAQQSTEVAEALTPRPRFPPASCGSRCSRTPTPSAAPCSTPTRMTMFWA